MTFVLAYACVAAGALFGALVMSLLNAGARADDEYTIRRMAETVREAVEALERKRKDGE